MLSSVLYITDKLFELYLILTEYYISFHFVALVVVVIS